MGCMYIFIFVIFVLPSLVNKALCVYVRVAPIVLFLTVTQVGIGKTYVLRYTVESISSLQVYDVILYATHVYSVK